MNEHGRLDWRRALRAHCAVPASVPADDFWSLFRARAALVPRVARRPAVAALRLWGGRLGWVTAVCVVGVAVWIGIRPPPAVGPLAPERLTLAGLSTVDQVDVRVPYGSLLIVRDPQHGGTLVWVAGVQPAGDG